MILIRLLHGFRINIEAVGIFHPKPPAPDQTHPRTKLVAAFPIHLPECERQLDMRGQVTLRKPRHNFLGSWREAILLVVPVAKRKHDAIALITIPALGFVPQLFRLKDRQIDFQSADGVHLFPHNVLDLGEHSHSERSKNENTCRELSDVTAADQ